MGKKKLKILLFGDPILRQVAKPVNVFHKKLHLTIDSIAEALKDSNDGAALASTQVGIMKRIVVINYMNEYIEMVNPAIIEASGEEIDYEGCLSLPGYTGQVPRSHMVKVKYYDRNGIENIIEKSGRFARCIQHEIDHLDGILYIDRMKEKFITHTETKNQMEVESILKLSSKEIL